MARQKSGKTVKSINFDVDVLDALIDRCGKEKVSHFVNNSMRKIIMSDFEYYREKARYHNKKMQDYLYLRDSASDRSERKK